MVTLRVVDSKELKMAIKLVVFFSGYKHDECNVRTASGFLLVWFLMHQYLKSTYLQMNTNLELE